MGVAGRLVSAATAAQRLGVSTRTLRRYTADGTLPDRRSPGGRRVFDPDELSRLTARRGDVPVVVGALALRALKADVGADGVIGTHSVRDGLINEYSQAA
ncbi:MerR family DNA-binding transcriptional regulator [Actinoplanes derwentensis]|uniref:MerR family DNA-binding transcriptional regulator n=1 Tax=Actinoplanes derwentensis TaxID=113562 RepID=UPI000B876120|nr:MerR family DNA-binding transcriptional regulator [Actinoplanes derwentensis]GID84821.1 hypothetical protein Ade03nite_37450 [Actinoplanes derwentensis]